MIVIEDLFRPDERWRAYASQPEMDPLTEVDALQEAQLLDVRFDALRSTVGLLFELRMALQLREANTGVLIARGVRDLSWTAGARSTDRTAWVVLGSAPEARDRLFGLSLLTRPKGELTLLAESAAFFVGDAAGLDIIPDYGTDDEAIVQANLAGWRSDFAPMHAVFLDAAP